MTVDSPRIRSLLRQADSVAAAGKRAAAEQLYRQVIDEAPETAEAWRGLALVVRNADEKDAAMKRAQELDPDYRPEAEVIDDPSGPLAGREVQTETEAGETTFSNDGKTSEGQSAELVLEQGTAEVAQQSNHAHEHSASSVKAADTAETREMLYCANHPSRPTNLRCNRCGKPICSKCANPTPVGYRCPECIREQEDVYYSATLVDYVITVLVVFPLSLVIGWIATRILASSLGFFLIFLGAFAGSLIGRVAFRVARRRRGRWLPHLTVACVIIGGLLPALPFFVAALYGQFSLRLLFLGIYLFAAAGATFYQMR